MRSAWLLCNDEILELTDVEEQLGIERIPRKLMPLADAARLLGRPVGTVSSDVNRAKQKLREEFSDTSTRTDFKYG